MEEIIKIVRVNKLSIALLLGVLLISLVHADSIGNYKQETDIELYQTCNNCTYCNFTDVKIISPIKQTLLTNLSTSVRGTYFFYNLTSQYTSTIGTYNYCYDCGNGIDRATGCIDFDVSSSGDKPTQNQGWMIVGQLGVAAMLIILGLTLSKNKWKLKTFFFVSALIMGIIILNSVRIISASSGSLNSMGNTGMIMGIAILSFMIMYFLVYMMIDVFHELKDKKERRFEPL